MLRLTSFVVLALALLGRAATDDINVYIDAGLGSDWQNWSWNTEANFAATDIFAGTSGSSISVTSTAWSALSLKLGSSNFADYAGLKFDVAGPAADVQIYFDSTTESITSASVPLSSIVKDVKADSFTSVLIDFSALPGSGAPLGKANWDRVSFQARGDGATYHLDNIVLVAQLVVTPEFLSAEPIGSNVVAVTAKGTVDFTTLKVALNGKPLTVASRSTYTPVDTPKKQITYLTTTTPFAPGNLTVTAGTTSFITNLPAAQPGGIAFGSGPVIDPLIYGVNFPPSADYIKHLGVTVSRWGGNAVTAYNPDGHFTNAGNDWFFENRVTNEGGADDWMGWVKGAGSQALLTVPALDWVSKDGTSYSYPKTLFPDQQKYDPYKPDAGNGLLPNGSWVSPPDPTNVYKPWNTTLAKNWLAGLKNKPQFVAIDNEIEIASSTHQDMHPEPLGYDEQLSRVVSFGTAAKAAIPNVKVFAPSTCSWWFYWTTVIGWTDTTAHNNTDFLPWFLGEMKKAEKKAGKRILDYLDIHYYYQPDLSANDAAANAIRMRMTRSLWDPSYVDESWAGRDPQNHQPLPDRIMLIPRFKKLIQDIYPGTKLSISEWSSTRDEELTGGLVTVDSLGLFGKYGVDAATYWATPGEVAPVGLAYWLFRGYGIYFGSFGAQVNLAKPNPDLLGAYAATDARGKLSLVVVNKDPAKAQSFSLAGVAPGKYFLRHFGGKAGVAKYQTNVTLAGGYIVVPAYTAAFLQQL